MAREERVFALQRDGADCALNGVAVHLDATIGQEQDQPVPVLAMYLTASPEGDFAETCVRA